MTRISLAFAVICIVFASTFKSAFAFDGNRKGFVLGWGAGVGVLSDENLWGFHSALKIGSGISDRLLLFYSGNSTIFEGGAILLAPTAALSYYLRSGTPTVYFTGGLGFTIVGSILGEELGPHFLAGVGIEVFRHWSVELSVLSIYFESGSLTNYALTVNVLGF